MKSLNREAIQRMVGNSPQFFSSGGGGGGGTDLTGMASQAWVNENYLSIDFFSSLFKAYDSASTPNEIMPNGGDTTAITNIKAMFGFWTEQHLSALGQGSGGGGGTGTLADLVDVELNNPTNGQALVYNATSEKWENQSIGGGGGGGTLTSIGLVMPTGFSVSPATLTQDGSFTVGFSTGYGLPLTADVQKGVTAYGWGDHAQAGYWSPNNHPTTLSGYGITDAIGAGTSFWGQTVNNGVVNGNMTNVGNITMNGNIFTQNGFLLSAQDTDDNSCTLLTFNSSNIFALGYGVRLRGHTTDIQGNTIQIAVGTTRTEAVEVNSNGRFWVRQGAQGLRIGDALLTWDATNKVLNLTNVTTGQVASFAASGGVSALQ